MKLFLHIGNHKTGSTTIQSSLLKNKNILLQKFNILYPDTGLIRGAHHLFPSLLLEKKKIFNMPIEIKYEKLLEKFKEEIKEYNPEIIVISSEEFFIFRENEIKKLNKLFDLFDEVELVVYLRNQADHLESAYKFNVLWENSKEKRSFSSFLKKVLNTEYHFYDKRLLEWEKIYPSLKINILNFDEEIRKVFLNSFYENVLKIKFHVKEEKKNASLSRFSTLILNSLNRFEIKNDERNEYIELLKIIDAKYPRLKKERLYTEEKYNSVVNYYYESNIKLKNLFGIDLNKYFELKYDIILRGDFYTDHDIKILIENFKEYFEIVRDNKGNE